MNTITSDKGIKYLIRGNASADELRKRYDAFVYKFKSAISFDEWLRTRGGVYVRINERNIGAR